MIKWVKNNKILTAIFFAVLILIAYRLSPATFHFGRQAHREFRHDYQAFKKLAGTSERGANIYGKNGYIVKIYYHYPEDFEKKDIAIINSLSQLRVLRIGIVDWNDAERRELVCTQMVLLGKIDNKNLIELQYDFDDEPWIDCMHLPRSVITLRIRANIGNEGLMRLAKFDHLKEILVYDKAKDGCEVTAMGVKAFNEIRPDVKVWWSGDVNMERNHRDYSDFSFPLFEYPYAYD